MYLASPTDTALAQLLGAVLSPEPEHYGADVLAGTRSGLAGWQRKTVADLVASLEDGRLAWEIPLLRCLDYPTLVMEGSPAYANGYLITQGRASRYTRAMVRNLGRSLTRRHGVLVEHSLDLQDTVNAIQEQTGWLNKPGRGSLESRPKMDRKDTWGKTTRDSRLQFFLQGIDGLGPVHARAILEHFQDIPVRWTCNQEELAQVRGLGPVLAKRFWEELNG